MEDPPAVDETATDAGSESIGPPEDTTDEPAPEAEDGEPAEPEGDGDGHEYAFGEGAAFAHPVGAYEHEFQDGVEEDVVYTVDDVTLDAAGQAVFTLTIEVPQLERVFGLANLDMQCSYQDGATHPADSDDPVTEAEAGTHSMELSCDAPEAPGAMTVSMVNGEDEADFSGPVG